MNKIGLVVVGGFGGVAAASAIARTAIGVLSVEKDDYFEGHNT